MPTPIARPARASLRGKAGLEASLWFTAASQAAWPTMPAMDTAVDGAYSIRCAESRTPLAAAAPDPAATAARAARLPGPSLSRRCTWTIAGIEAAKKSPPVKSLMAPKT